MPTYSERARVWALDVALVELDLASFGDRGRRGGRHGGEGDDDKGKLLKELHVSTNGVWSQDQLRSRGSEAYLVKRRMCIAVDAPPKVD